MEKKKQIVLKLLTSCLVCTLICSLLVSCVTDGESETESATETIAQTEEKTEGKTEGKTEAPTETEEKTEAKTEAPSETEAATENKTETEPETETEKPDVAEVKIPELLDGALDFTFHFTETLYTTKTETFCYAIQSNSPGGYICRGDKWALYRIDGDEITLVGEIAHEIALEYEAPSETEYIISHEHLSFTSLCGKPTLEAGDYCLVFLIQAPDENGYYHTYAGAKSKIFVIEE